ncbi:sensor histidine kinase [Salinimicrobium oceani]|uniref:histidine kinase n=1 Tax=Salinimicrobium oceani TaxID=2722702 RepID=A0ABX1CU35_9FLAO|nr:ATP-binding protein [Salinimicrobium oceani]NJW51800.1 GHKL domain-containing protein [Salinimicrobium oceani]
MPLITSTKEELQERIKELSCLYEVSSLLRQHSGNNKNTLRKIAGVLKEAWRFPEEAVVQIKLDSFEYSTEKAPKNGIFQEAEFSVFDEERGRLRIFYPAPQFSQKHFLPEEQKLLEKVADEIASFYEKQLRLEHEELLRRSVQRNDRLAILGEITAGIAHELNTPMGNILGFAELIEERAESEQTKQDISRIIKAAIFSREVVKKLMFFACEMPQRMEVIEVKPIVEQTLSLLKQNFKKAQVTYSLEMPQEELKAQLDPIQLTQVLFNLLINALYFAPENSNIKVKIFMQEPNFIIEIADMGPGIKATDRSKIFEPFFTTKPTGEGSGLGLSVVHGIVKSHKGKILTFNNEPKGTVFQIQLPLKM